MAASTAGRRVAAETPSVTFVLPLRPDCPAPLALAAIDRLDYPREFVEVIIASGTNPSRQRNAALARARGELVYFVDDDSVLDPRVLSRALEVLADAPDVAGVGGPVLTLATDTPFQKAAGAALGSVLGLGPFRHRFTPYGLVREAGETELISANLIVRRSVLALERGFDERLYGNEENELMNRLRNQGARLFYHPLMFCRRSQRASLPAVFAQTFSYGRGRARHFAIAPRSFRPFLLLPLGLLATLVLALAWRSPLFALPLALYMVLVVAAAGFTALQGAQPVRRFCALLAIFPAMHFGYASGMLWELVRIVLGRAPPALARPQQEIRVRVARTLGTSDTPAFAEVAS